MDVLTIIFMVCGLFTGVANESVLTSVLSAMIGFLAGRFIHLSQSLKALQNKVNHLQQALSQDWEQRQTVSNLPPTTEKTTASDPLSSIQAKPELESDSVLPPKVQTDPVSVQEPVLSKPLASESSPVIQSEVLATQAVSQPNALTESNEPLLNEIEQEIQTYAQNSSQPNVIDQSVLWIKRYFTEGNLFVRTGILVLFVGIAFLLKYASEHTTISIGVRVACVAILGLAAIGLGWFLRNKRPTFGLAVQGGGLGVLYLSIFAAFRLYQLIPSGLAFTLLCLVGVAAAVLSIVQNTRSLIIFGVIGGFVAPILSSTGTGSHVQLFAYYLLVNVGVLLVSWFKAWRELNLLGFFFTFFIGTMWGVAKYEPEHFSSTEPFLMAYFLLYVVVAILFTRNQSNLDQTDKSAKIESSEPQSLFARPRVKGYVDATLIFANPIATFALQSFLVADYEYGMAWSAFGLGVFYLLITVGLRWFKHDGRQRLQQCFLSLGILFSTLAVAFAFDSRLTSSVWAIEGAILLWLWKQQSNVLGRIYAQVLQLSAGGLFFWSMIGETLDNPFSNAAFTGGLLVVGAALWSAYLLRSHVKQLKTWELALSTPWLAYGSLVWLFVVMHQVGLLDQEIFNQSCLVLLIMSVTCLVYQCIGRLLTWCAMRAMSLMVTPLLLSLVALSMLVEQRFLVSWGQWAWPLSLCAFWLTMLLSEDNMHHQYSNVESAPVKSNEYTIQALLQVQHFIGAALTLFVIQVEWHHVLAEIWNMSSEMQLALALLPTFVILFIMLTWMKWPISKFKGIYHKALPVCLLGLVVVWFFEANWRTSGDELWQYIPVLNSLTLSSACALGLIFYWWRRVMRVDYAELTPYILALMMGLGFYAVNAMLLRTLHHTADIPFEFNAFYDSVLVQLSLSVLWSALSVATILIASKKRWRMIWIIGACMAAAVVAKLFLIDLGNSGTIERIVSFLVVGVVLMLIGYFSPMPPESDAQSSAKP